MRIDELDAEIEKLRLELANGDDQGFEKINTLIKERDEEKRKVL